MVIGVHDRDTTRVRRVGPRHVVRGACGAHHQTVRRTGKAWRGGSLYQTEYKYNRGRGGLRVGSKENNLSFSRESVVRVSILTCSRRGHRARPAGATILLNSQARFQQCNPVVNLWLLLEERP